MVYRDVISLAPAQIARKQKTNPPVLWRGDSWSSVFHHSAVVVVEHAMHIDRSRSQTTRGVTFSRLVPKLSLQVRPAIVRCHLHSDCQPETLVRSREMGAPLLFTCVEWSEHSPLRGPHEPQVEETGWRHTLAAITNLPPLRGGSKGRTLEKERKFHIRRGNLDRTGLPMGSAPQRLRPGQRSLSGVSENIYVYF